MWSSKAVAPSGAACTLSSSSLFFFSVQRLHGFRQVVQYAPWHRKIINFQIKTRGRLLIEDRKRELVTDLYIAQKAVISTNKTNNSKQTTKTRKNQKQPNKNQTKNQHPQEWQTTSPLEDSCKRRQLCVISSWYGHKQKHKKGRTPTHTRPYPQVIEATQHHAETRDPPSQELSSSSLVSAPSKVGLSYLALTVSMCERCLAQKCAKKCLNKQRLLYLMHETELVWP